MKRVAAPAAAEAAPKRARRDAGEEASDEAASREPADMATPSIAQQPAPPVLSELSLAGVASLIHSGRCRRVLVMAGAGISCSAGIPDFRTPGTGLYDNLARYDLPRPECIFELDYFVRRPEPFFALARDLYPGRYRPTPAHWLLRLLHDHGVLLRLYTQNIDGLERLAGLPDEALVEAHGSFSSARCVFCRADADADAVRAAILAGRRPADCSVCGGLVKPDIVFFGEGLPSRFHRLAPRDTRACDLLLVMGTSLKVHPFASLVELVGPAVPRVLVNLERAGLCAEALTLEDFERLLGRDVDEALRASGFGGGKGARAGGDEEEVIVISDDEDDDAAAAAAPHSQRLEHGGDERGSEDGEAAGWLFGDERSSGGGGSGDVGDGDGDGDGEAEAAAAAAVARGALDLAELSGTRHEQLRAVFEWMSRGGMLEAEEDGSAPSFGAFARRSGLELNQLLDRVEAERAEREGRGAPPAPRGRFLLQLAGEEEEEEEEEAEAEEAEAEEAEAEEAEAEEEAEDEEEAEEAPEAAGDGDSAGRSGPDDASGAQSGLDEEAEAEAEEAQVKEGEPLAPDTRRAESGAVGRDARLRAFFEAYRRQGRHARGFRFGLPDNRRDVFVGAPCDDAARELAGLLGWAGDLERLAAAPQQRQPQSPTQS